MSQSWIASLDLPAPYVELVETLLKCVKNISMEPSALEYLEAAGAIPALIPIMSGPLGERAKVRAAELGIHSSYVEANWVSTDSHYALHVQPLPNQQAPSRASRNVWLDPILTAIDHRRFAFKAIRTSDHLRHCTCVSVGTHQIVGK